MAEATARKERPGRAGEARPSAGGGGPAEMGNALEALRVASTLLVVLYHAGLTYVATPLRLTLWVAFEPSGHVAFDTFIYWVNGFVMPAFFLAAGVSAPAACESRGPRVFLTHRANRLLRPLLFGILTILPIFYLLWGYGLMVTGRCDLDSILSWHYAPPIRRDLYGLGHFWFLEYLFLVCLVWCAGWWLRSLRHRGVKVPAAEEGGLARRMLASPWRPLLFAIPTAAIFLVDSDTMLRVDNTIVPNLFRLLHYAFFFAVGGWIARVREPKALFIRFGTVTLVLSFVVFARMWPLLIRHAAEPLQGVDRVKFCVLAALFPWLTIFGALGVLLRVVRTRGPAMRFLTEASFWVYLVHVPIVALIQILLLPLDWPAPVKFLVVSAVALAISFASYGPIVRHSLIGVVINGARKRTPKRPFLGPEFGWIATLGVVVLLFAAGAWSARVFLWGHNLHAVVPGQVYRSARLKPEALDPLIRREGLRSVVTFSGGGERHPSFSGLKKVCDRHGVAIQAIDLREGQIPSRDLVVRLIDVLERSPRPILVQGYRGVDQAGFAAALTQLLDGTPPRVALHQFDIRFGQFGGPEHSTLGVILLDYQHDLNARHLTHTPQRFQAWAREEYVARVNRRKDRGEGQRITRGERGASAVR